MLEVIKQVSTNGYLAEGRASLTLCHRFVTIFASSAQSSDQILKIKHPLKQSTTTTPKKKDLNEGVLHLLALSFLCFDDPAVKSL